SVRAAAAEALGQAKIKSENNIAALTEALNDNSDQVQLAAFGAFGHVDRANPAPIRWLKKQSGKPSVDNHVLSSLVDALGRIGLAAEPAVPMLRGLARKQDGWIGTNAIEALGGIGPGAKVALPEVTDALTHRELGHRLAAAQALWRIHHDS